MDFVILLVAFVRFCRQTGVPPPNRFLAAGFILNALGYTNNDALQIIADLGITILLFTIGIAPQGSVARPVWVSGLSHTAIWVAVVSLFIFVLGSVLMLEVFNTSFTTAALISFALSFSSTVCVIKILDKPVKPRLDTTSSIGILVIQDILAVLFLVFSTGKIPSIYAFGLFLLLPCQPLIHKLLFKSGHGELLPLTGFIFAFGAYSLFEMVGVKGDLGALVAGVMLATHAKANELSKALYGFKDLFLVGFLNDRFKCHADMGDVSNCLVLVCFLDCKVCLVFWFIYRITFAGTNGIFKCFIVVQFF